MTAEPVPGRQALAVLAAAVALLAAVVIQVTVVNRLPLPGSAAPDLVLLLVTAIAVTAGPAAGAVSGFAGGLALDVAPPAAHYAGEYALVFCLAGYAAARVVRVSWQRTGERDRITAVAVMAVAVMAGEAGKAALGLLLSDPEVTGAAIARVLPGAIGYDLLLAPAAFWLAARVTRGAVAGNTAPAHAPAPEFSRAQRTASVYRQASAGAAPNLRLAGTGEGPRGPSAARRVARLRLSDARSAPARTTGSGPRGPVTLAGARGRRLNFSGDLAGRAPRPVRTPARSRPRGGGRSRLRAAAPQARAARSAAPSLTRGHLPRHGWLAGAGLSGGGRARRVRYGAAPSPSWLRRSRHPWRKRRQRLLRLVGVGR